MWATTLWDHGTPAVQWTVTCVATMLSAVIDARTRRIPNWITGPVYLLGLGWASWAGGWSGLADGFAASVLLALPYVILFVYAGGGAGDAKLMAGVGAWLGLINGGITLGAVALSGVVLGFAYALLLRQARATASNVMWMASSLFVNLAHRRGVSGTSEAPPARHTVPYGIAIFAGTVLAAAGIAVWRRRS